MVATGVPQTLLLSQRISSLEEVVQKCFEALNNNVREELIDLRNNFQELPTAVSETLRANGQVEDRPVQVMCILLNRFKLYIIYSLYTHSLYHSLYTH